MLFYDLAQGLVIRGKIERYIKITTKLVTLKYLSKIKQLYSSLVIAQKMWG